jgi:hypothetical protein
LLTLVSDLREKAAARMGVHDSSTASWARRSAGCWKGVTYYFVCRVKAGSSNAKPSIAR